MKESSQSFWIHQTWLWGSLQDSTYHGDGCQNCKRVFSHGNFKICQVSTVRKAITGHKSLPKAEGKVHGRKEPSCYQYNGSHSPKDCTFENAECYNCHRKGHTAAACESRPRNKGKDGRKPQAWEKCMSLKRMQSISLMRWLYIQYPNKMVRICEVRSVNHFETKVMINDRPLKMMINTAADCSIMSKVTYEQNFSN